MTTPLGITLGEVGTSCKRYSAPDAAVGVETKSSYSGGGPAIGGGRRGVGRMVGAFVGADPLSVLASSILFAARYAICHVKSIQT